MKLKYYLRGMGAGIVITTMIFIILILIHRNDGVQQNVSTQDTESKTVAEYENDTQKAEDADKPETIPQADTETIKPVNKPADTAKTKEPEAESEEQTDLEEEQENQENPDAEEEQGNHENPNAEESVQIEVSNGQFSDSVCAMLQEAGLIADASDFNKYLVENKYDNSIYPGTYDIPKGASYEEIANLLTRK